jgi:putative spermidine/putrescine transport system ATP-binding protein/spermidine/putrescine transport system ATP-binding protein
MPRETDAAMLEIDEVVHHYGPVLALDHVSLSARRGEFLTILGESGSGKTTLLRVISGLEHPTRVKRLAIDGEDVVGVRPAHRRCTTVFQNYALFPHMSVEENVGYGLRVRGVPHEDVVKEARRMLAMVRLEAKAQRRIAELSGGERQRVALARAVITKPAILLLDEPLGALDEKLRLDMQSELVALQRQLGMTFVYITHSQEEALTMSDRVVLMQRGRIAQTGRPIDLFDRPASRFVAEFMGFENLLPAVVRSTEADGSVTVEAKGGYLLRGLTPDGSPVPAGKDVVAAVRAERMSLAAGAEGASNRLPCTLADHVYRGKYIDQSGETPAGKVRLRRWDRAAPAEADAVTWQVDDCVILSS